MNIAEAMRSRTNEKPFITRAAWKHTNKMTGEILQMLIDPTNTPDCCVVYSKISTGPRRRWNPKAEDLSADDWTVEGLWY